jgi:Tol biopolymer transport system component
MDGSNGHWVRPTQYPFQLAEPSWSPDGSRIVLTVQLNGGQYLATMDVASGQVNLVNPAGIQGREPSYDPTGQKIIYVSHDLKSIRQVNADGTGQKVRVSSATALGHPTFSPDGKKIAYHRIVGLGYPDIFVKNLVDGSVKRLTSVAASDIQPTWSPEGSRIAFASLRSGKFQIYTVSATGGIATRITNTGTDERNPAWSH